MTSQKITELENLLSNMKTENSLQKAYITSLEQSYINLETEYARIKTMYSSIASKEGSMKLLQSKLNEKEDTIHKLQKELEKEIARHQKYKLDYDLQYEKDVNQAKYIHENNLAKIENANKIEKLCKNLYEINVKYEKIIETYEEEEKKRVKEREVEFEKQMSDMKKKMLDYIKNGQKNGNVFNAKQSDLNAKLSILHNNQLLSELEFQSLQIEDLLKQREHLDKLVLELKNDIKVHTEVEKVLSTKNKKYTNMIKVLSNKVDELNANQLIKMTNSNKTLSQFELSQNRFLLHSNSTGKIISAQKEIINKQKTINNYKTKYDTLKAKHDNILIRFSNIISHFESVLEKIYNDPSFPKMKELYINIDDFKKCEFELLNPEQKYSAIVMIIKYLLPIIGKEVVSSSDVFSQSSNTLCKRFDHIKTKFCFGKEDSTKTFTSLGGDTKSNNNTFNVMMNNTHQFRHLRYKSVSDFKRNTNSKTMLVNKGRMMNRTSFQNDPTNDVTNKKLYSLLKVNS